MTHEERVTTYIRSLDPGHGSLCDEIAVSARNRSIPVIRPETALFLQTVVAARRPESILEVGTAVGYSALLMSRMIPDHVPVITIEKYEPRILEARENFRRAGKDGQITLLEGDAKEILGRLTDRYDFIFMDAAKGQYIHWLPLVMERLAPGGVLFSDNVLQDGDIIESRFAVERRNRTIHSRMREYLYTLTHMEELVTSVIPIGDGVALSVRRS